MFKITLMPKKKSKLYEEFGDNTVFYYPVSVEENVINSVGIMRDTTQTEVNKIIDEARIKHNVMSFYRVNNDNWLFFSARPIAEELTNTDIFEVLPFQISNRDVVYYLKDSIFDDTLIKAIDQYLCSLGWSVFGMDIKVKLYGYLSEVGWDSEIFEVDVEECEFCGEDGPNILLHILLIVNPDTLKEDQRDLLIFMLKHGFLSRWIRLDDIEDSIEREDLFNACKTISKVRTYESLYTQITDILTNLVGNDKNREIFNVLYSVSKSANSDSSLGIVNTLFSIIKKEKIITHMPSQPELIIKKLELDFVLNSFQSDLADIKRKLGEINLYVSTCHEFSIPKYESRDKTHEKEAETIQQCRFSVELEVDADYTKLSEVLYSTEKKIKEKLNELHLNPYAISPHNQKFYLWWLKKMYITIISPEVFGDEMIIAMGKKFPMAIKNKTIEGDLLKIDAEVLLDDSLYKKDEQTGEYKFKFPEKFARDVAYSFAYLNELINDKYHYQIIF